MLTRKDGTLITPENLTDEDVALSDWSIFDRLDSEERIARYLKGTVQDIKEGECDAGFLFDALADATKARAINQLARETGLDRKIFYEIESESNIPAINHEVIVKVVESFAVPVPV